MPGESQVRPNAEVNAPEYLAFAAPYFYLHSMYSTFTTIEKGLRQLVKGDVWFDIEKRKEYSTAKCLYRIMPVGVVAPKDTDDVRHIITLCAENDIAVIPRGGGTGLAGQAVGFGLILDFTKHMNHVLSVSEETSSVTVEAGCILSDLNAILQPTKTFYPIDPQSARTCTVGGTIATNAAGAHGLRYGSTKNQLKNLTAVFSNGDLCSVNPIEEHSHLSAETERRFMETKKLLVREKEVLRGHVPKVEKSSSGYNIFEAMSGDNFDATRLLCGSEGTLAIVTQATLNIEAVPETRAAALAYFESYEKTAEAIQVAREFSPSAIELLDKSYTEIGKGISPLSDRFINRDFKTMLLIEFEGGKEVGECLNDLHAALLRSDLLLDWHTLESNDERIAMWQLRETATEQLNALPSRQRKISTFEDGAVPVRNLPSYLAGMKTILEKYSIPFIAYGHAGSGHIHCTTIGEIETESGRKLIDDATREMFDLIIRLDGTLSAEHGDGFVRTPFLERAFGPDIYRIFTEIKRIFDPQNILNPQKIVGKQNGVFLHDIKYA